MVKNKLLNDLFNLEGRVAVVTGATKGLGRTMAETLAQAGARVAICSRNRDEAVEAAEEITRISGSQCAGFEADVSRPEDIERFFSNAEKDLGPVDVLIANAGIVIRKDSMECSGQEWDHLMDVNLRGSFLCARAVLPGMRERRWGRIIFIGSILSFVSIAGRAAYASSKAAILGLTRTLALENAADGICINAICPGPFKTPNNLPVLRDENANKAFLANLPIGRWGEPEEIAGLTLYLSSNACGFMTGSSVLIDGGWTLR